MRRGSWVLFGFLAAFWANVGNEDLARESLCGQQPAVNFQKGNNQIVGFGDFLRARVRGLGAVFLSGTHPPCGDGLVFSAVICHDFLGKI